MNENESKYIQIHSEQRNAVTKINTNVLQMCGDSLQGQIIFPDSITPSPAVGDGTSLV